MSLPGGTVVYNAGASSLYMHIFGDQDGDQIMPLSTVWDRYRRLGQVGSGGQTLGSEAPDCRVSAHYLATSMADALAKQKIIMLWPGSVTIVDPLGSSWTAAVKNPVTARVRTGKYNLSGVQYLVRVSTVLTIEAQN